MSDNNRIYLVGPMGAGKSTVGLGLSAMLGQPFADTDSIISAQLQCNITQIFNDYGESYFRCLETELLAKLARQSQVVVATGGGIIVNKINRDMLHSTGKVVYLQVSKDIQAYRLSTATDRPLLIQINDLLYREQLYADIAHITINTDHMTISSVITKILEKFKECAWI